MVSNKWKNTVLCHSAGDNVANKRVQYQVYLNNAEREQLRWKQSDEGSRLQPLWRYLPYGRYDNFGFCVGGVCPPTQKNKSIVILYLQNETKIAKFRYLRKWTEAVKDKDY